MPRCKTNHTTTSSMFTAASAGQTTRNNKATCTQSQPDVNKQTCAHVIVYQRSAVGHMDGIGPNNGEGLSFIIVLCSFIHYSAESFSLVVLSSIIILQLLKRDIFLLETLILQACKLDQIPPA